ncbi:abortive infection system antitoxin AbiGi family protein [Mesonia aestuariivivens]|uniref:Uncharacterized protein n=1 Tax=Mesonia aestuariivivens TaxID=2796128 RepID=A0ABS6W2Q3_9FLAO|nr:abortive infection system antitoxin AbiGi family protein [Mesonia aestuariivivens]MBW2962136.1 hypothetical protein [Mesonia aestuariivivens]
MALEISLSEQIFNYKKIPHLLQYTEELETIEKILKSKSFKPSYCKENFGNYEILIPMVSFCNIPLSLVPNFLYYGDYGIGLSQEWGIKNNIEPVKYLVNNTPLKINSLSENIKAINNIRYLLQQKPNDIRLGLGLENETKENSHFKLPLNIIKSMTDPEKPIQDLLELTIKNIQFSKYWEAEVKKHIILKDNKDKVVYKNENFKSTINCYNEREWRFVPTIENTDTEIYPRIINSNDKNLQDLFKKYSSRETKKPHFRQNNYSLKFDLEDIKYILVKEKNEVPKIIDCLKTTFEKENVSQKLENGNLIILTRNRIFQDF